MLASMVFNIQWRNSFSAIVYTAVRIHVTFDYINHVYEHASFLKKIA